MKNNNLIDPTKSVAMYKDLKLGGLSDKLAAKHSPISRATFYRRRNAITLMTTRPNRLRSSTIPSSTWDLILRLRCENPTYGKAKIAILLHRDFHLKISESSVGRIIKQLKDSNLIDTSTSYPNQKRRRRFNGHAQKYEPKLQPKTVGHLVQIDHMSVQKNGLKFKQFVAWDRTTKMIVTDVKDDAGSGTAANFLDKVIAELPFKLVSVQVDGGSEFMDKFEEKCKTNNITLYVLPPRRPQCNGGVERTNKTFREEFYCHKTGSKTLLEIREKLQAAQHKHNNYRPHFSLKGLTPMLFFEKLTDFHEPKKSHMY
jgi:putative transposase